MVRRHHWNGARTEKIEYFCFSHRCGTRHRRSLRLLSSPPSIPSPSMGLLLSLPLASGLGTIATSCFAGFAFCFTSTAGWSYLDAVIPVQALKGLSSFDVFQVLQLQFVYSNASWLCSMYSLDWIIPETHIGTCTRLYSVSIPCWRGSWRLRLLWSKSKSGVMII